MVTEDQFFAFMEHFDDRLDSVIEALTFFVGRDEMESIKERVARGEAELKILKDLGREHSSRLSECFARISGIEQQLS